MRVRLDKIASSTRNAGVGRRVVIGSEIPARPGAVVVARVLTDKAVYNQLEDVHGRLMTVHAGDVIAGVLGARRALRGYSGVVPDAVLPGDRLQLLNLGGVIGRCTSASPDVGAPHEVEVLGSVLQFPDIGRRVGVPATIDHGEVCPADVLTDLPPCVFVVGTCMHAGKTAAACSLIRAATARGLSVGACKVTGVALRRDTLQMQDHGAVWACSFADAGLPSTCGASVLPAARGCLNAVAKQGVDLIVVELGDGLLGTYGVKEVLDGLSPAIGALVLAAGDPVGAWGGAKLLEDGGFSLTAITGPATDNDAGSGVLSQLAPVVANARTSPEALASGVLGAMGWGCDGGVACSA